MPPRKSIYNTKKTSDRRLATFNNKPPVPLISPNEKLSQETINAAIQILTKLKERRNNKSKNAQKKSSTHGNNNNSKGSTTKEFKLFIGNLSNEVTEEMILYKLINLKIPTENLLDLIVIPNKGYGFISFTDPNDYLTCYKSLNKKFIGLKPVDLKKSSS